MDFSEYRVLDLLSQKVYESCDHETVNGKSCPLQILQDSILYLELSHSVKDDDTQILALLWEQSNCNKISQLSPCHMRPVQFGLTRHSEQPGSTR